MRTKPQQSVPDQEIAEFYAQGKRPHEVAEILFRRVKNYKLAGDYMDACRQKYDKYERQVARLYVKRMAALEEP